MISIVTAKPLFSLIGADEVIRLSQNNKINFINICLLILKDGSSIKKITSNITNE